MKLTDDEVGDLKELVQSFGWKLLNRILAERNAAYSKSLLCAENMTDVRRCQSNIRAIEELLRFPRQLIQENKHEEKG